MAGRLRLEFAGALCQVRSRGMDRRRSIAPKMAGACFSSWKHLRNQVFVGLEAFAENMRRQIPKDRELTELPQARQRSPAKSLRDYVRESPDRNASIVAAYRGETGSCTLRKIQVAISGDPISRTGVTRLTPQVRAVVDGPTGARSGLTTVSPGSTACPCCKSSE